MIDKQPLVFNRNSISEFKPKRLSVLISVTSPVDEHPTVTDSLYLDVLRLKFWDVESPDPNGVFNVMTDEQANEIANFVKKAAAFKTEIQIVVNCDAGISRSSAIAAAISKYYFKDDSFYYKNYAPNSLVYRKVLKSLQN